MSYTSSTSYTFQVRFGNRSFSASFSSHGIFESKHNICDGQCPLRIKFAVFLMESTNVMSAQTKEDPHMRGKT